MTPAIANFESLKTRAQDRGLNRNKSWGNAWQKPRSITDAGSRNSQEYWFDDNWTDILPLLSLKTTATVHLESNQDLENENTLMNENIWKQLARHTEGQNWKDTEGRIQSGNRVWQCVRMRGGFGREPMDGDTERARKQVTGRGGKTDTKGTKTRPTPEYSYRYAVINTKDKFVDFPFLLFIHYIWHVLSLYWIMTPEWTFWKMTSHSNHVAVATADQIETTFNLPDSIPNEESFTYCNEARMQK